MNRIVKPIYSKHFHNTTQKVQAMIRYLHTREAIRDFKHNHAKDNRLKYMRDKQLLAQNHEIVLEGRLLYCILAFLGCSCIYNQRGNGWGDDCKIRVARRELLIAEAGLGGILRNQKLGGEICSARAYEQSNVKLQSCEKSLMGSKTRASDKGSQDT